MIERTMEGTGERRLARNRVHAPVSAIFVHAGAGYHSQTNEHIHLAACNDAAKVAMRVLKAGGTAVDAVEAAIKVLEDKEITNAGYGSNLTIEGVVECDAVVVDHLGRSGGCGATAKIRNPINLARIILETSNRPLSLRRVPPNLLVGEGATDFAWEHGLPVVPHDALVSKNSRDRYVRWRDDLKRAGGVHLIPGSPRSPGGAYGEELDFEYEESVRNQQRRDHTNAILSGTWNEGQPDSPAPRSPAPQFGVAESPPFFPSTPPSRMSSPEINLMSEKHYLNPTPPTRQSSRSPQPLSPGHTSSKRPRVGRSTRSESHVRTHSLLGPNSGGLEAQKSYPDVAVTVNDDAMNHAYNAKGYDGPTSPLKPHRQTSQEHYSLGAQVEPADIDAIDDDAITDTVGAIAIDDLGNIAAGASSGGIGMKHRGRVGPAALVGVGAAVIPVDPDDDEGITVAAVTSGTGEHMATTGASQKCAERLYYGLQRGRSGANIPATEEEAMDSFVRCDFMEHPGVKASHSVGAIGVMAVKKTPYGFFLHFAHNTDSFALASMHSNEREAKCVMSRIGDHRTVVQGGRKVRLD
ncbi:MAG: hypothetical protein M1818_001799 [Claussenomyces sp. TS43310]|nr:MAG: hypothetical protein M1818_001799 [Claussenomyces sp. TS43310]